MIFWIPENLVFFRIRQSSNKGPDLMTASCEKRNKFAAKNTTGARNEDVEWFTTAPQMDLDIFAYNVFPVVKDLLQTFANVFF